MPDGCELTSLRVEDPKAVAQQLAAAGVGCERLRQDAYLSSLKRGSVKLVNRKRDVKACLLELVAQREERHDGRTIEKHRVQEEVRGPCGSIRTQTHFTEMLTRRKPRDPAAALHEALMEDADVAGDRVAGIQLDGLSRERLRADIVRRGNDGLRQEAS